MSDLWYEEDLAWHKAIVKAMERAMPKLIAGHKKEWHIVEDSDGHRWLVHPNGDYVASFVLDDKGNDEFFKELVWTLDHYFGSAEQ